MSRRRPGQKAGIDWEAQPLGEEPDSVLAARLGVTSSTVSKVRLWRRIPPFAGQTSSPVRHAKPEDFRFWWREMVSFGGSGATWVTAGDLADFYGIPRHPIQSWGYENPPWSDRIETRSLEGCVLLRANDSGVYRLPSDVVVVGVNTIEVPCAGCGGAFQVPRSQSRRKRHFHGVACEHRHRFGCDPEREVLQQRPQRRPCRFCGEPMSFLRTWLGEEFCCTQHAAADRRARHRYPREYWSVGAYYAEAMAAVRAISKELRRAQGSPSTEER